MHLLMLQGLTGRGFRVIQGLRCLHRRLEAYPGISKISGMSVSARSRWQKIPKCSHTLALAVRAIGMMMEKEDGNHCITMGYLNP